MAYCGEVYVNRSDPAYGKWGILWKTRNSASYAKINGEIVYFETSAEAERWLAENRLRVTGGFCGDSYCEVVVIRDYRCYY